MRPVPQEIRRARTAWRKMLGRCTDPRNKDFARYGGRGITVHDPWLSFERFLADMGPCHAEDTLERKDNDGPYSPTNCVWADRKIQAKNRSSTRWIEYNGVRLTQRDWAKRIGINENTLRDRLHSGWPMDTALSTPASSQNSVLKKAASARRTRSTDGRFV